MEIPASSSPIIFTAILDSWHFHCRVKRPACVVYPCQWL